MPRKSSKEWKSNCFQHESPTGKMICRFCTAHTAFANHESNLKRHIAIHHPIEAAQNGIKIKTVSEEPPAKRAKRLSKTGFIKGCVEYIVMQLTPYSFFNTETTRELFNIHTSHFDITINASNVAKCVQQTADEIRKIIKIELQDKLVSIKLDIASRYNKSVLGVNVQFYSLTERKLVIRTLAMIQLNTQHSAVNLKGKK